MKLSFSNITILIISFILLLSFTLASISSEPNTKIVDWENSRLSLVNKLEKKLDLEYQLQMSFLNKVNKDLVKVDPLLITRLGSIFKSDYLNELRDFKEPAFKLVSGDYYSMPKEHFFYTKDAEKDYLIRLWFLDVSQLLFTSSLVNKSSVLYRNYKTASYYRLIQNIIERSSETLTVESFKQEFVNELNQLIDSTYSESQKLQTSKLIQKKYSCIEAIEKKSLITCKTSYKNITYLQNSNGGDSLCFSPESAGVSLLGDRIWFDKGCDLAFDIVIRSEKYPLSYSTGQNSESFLFIKGFPSINTRTKLNLIMNENYLESIYLNDKEILKEFNNKKGLELDLLNNMFYSEALRLSIVSNVKAQNERENFYILLKNNSRYKKLAFLEKHLKSLDSARAINFFYTGPIDLDIDYIKFLFDLTKRLTDLNDAQKIELIMKKLESIYEIINSLAVNDSCRSVIWDENCDYLKERKLFDEIKEEIHSISKAVELPLYVKPGAYSINSKAVSLPLNSSKLTVLDWKLF